MVEVTGVASDSVITVVCLAGGAAGGIGLVGLLVTDLLSTLETLGILKQQTNITLLGKLYI